MENLPSYISWTFIFTSLLTVFFFFRASGYSKAVITLLLSWMILQAIIAKTDFYTISDSIPPRFILLPLPPLICILFLFANKRGRDFIDRLDLKTLTILHIIRIPVEMVLFWLFLNKAVPQLMTFEGRNFDILSGLSAPFIFYLAFRKGYTNKTILLIWNIICLLLLMNIVINAVLSLPFPFQQFAFDQPNIAVLYFPFNWLPAAVVPLVLLSHLAAIRQTLILKNKT